MGPSRCGCRRRFRPGRALRYWGALEAYRALFRDRSFITYALTGGGHRRDVLLHRRVAFRFIQLYGVPAEHYGWIFGSNAAGFILMAQVNARLLRYRGPGFWLLTSPR